MKFPLGEHLKLNRLFRQERRRFDQRQVLDHDGIAKPCASRRCQFDKGGGGQERCASDAMVFEPGMRRKAEPGAPDPTTRRRLERVAQERMRGLALRSSRRGGGRFHPESLLLPWICGKLHQVSHWINALPVHIHARDIEAAERRQQSFHLRLVAPQRAQGDRLSPNLIRGLFHKRDQQRMRAHFDEGVEALLEQYFDGVCKQNGAAKVPNPVPPVHRPWFDHTHVYC